MARELLEVTGVRPLVEAALPALEPGERAAWLRAADGTADDADDDGDSEPWSNIGPQHQLLYATSGFGSGGAACDESRPEGQDELARLHTAVMRWTSGSSRRVSGRPSRLSLW